MSSTTTGATKITGMDLVDVMETPVCFMSAGKDPDGNPLVSQQRKTAG